eukprot:UN02457
MTNCYCHNSFIKFCKIFSISKKIAVLMTLLKNTHTYHRCANVYP